ncbi:MAG: nitric oxide reductase transcriptional regulator NorR [Calditrichaeota bacterium]|nr:nitric oxide reductase transcriptional regulator NorR [Calditrichota bacterium]
MNEFNAIVSVATDLTSLITAEDRYVRLLKAIKKVIPYHAAAILRYDKDTLLPLVANGLTDDVIGRRFLLKEHPRLDIICKSSKPVKFPADSNLPDPFDGMISVEAGKFQQVHACLGCPLIVNGKLIGVLTADAFNPNVFDKISAEFLSAISALAAESLRTADLINALEDAAKHQGLIARDLMRDVKLHRGSDLIGISSGINKLREEIDLVARSDFSVLIMGETGVGKELVARAIHQSSHRKSDPMIYINCAALPESLTESELFGHIKGAFTGATEDRSGKFEIADGGTLLLDEIGELSVLAQPKLLRTLQDGEIQRIGSERTKKVDVRVLAATNRNLVEEVRKGKFRADLFHRLNVYPIIIPPLRDRKDDIPLLSGYFCDITRRRIGSGPIRIVQDALDDLKNYPWPGNVRELGNVISRAALKATTNVNPGEQVLIRSHHLGSDFENIDSSVVLPGVVSTITPTGSVNMREEIRTFQSSLISRALANSDGNWAAAARSLGLQRSNLHHLAERLGMK